MTSWLRMFSWHHLLGHISWNLGCHRMISDNFQYIDYKMRWISENWQIHFQLLQKEIHSLLTFLLSFPVLLQTPGACCLFDEALSISVKKMLVCYSKWCQSISFTTNLLTCFLYHSVFVVVDYSCTATYVICLFLYYGLQFALLWILNLHSIWSIATSASAS